jgi:hypothetical protein
MKRKNTFLIPALLIASGTIARQAVDETTRANGPEPPSVSTPDISDVVVQPKVPAAPLLKIEKAEKRVAPPNDRASHAWTTTVGWHPGTSAFSDPVTHESQLKLVSIPLERLGRRTGD